jgi:hypothetical protein
VIVAGLVAGLVVSVVGFGLVPIVGDEMHATPGPRTALTAAVAVWLVGYADELRQHLRPPCYPPAR